MLSLSSSLDVTHPEPEGVPAGGAAAVALKERASQPHTPTAESTGGQFPQHHSTPNRSASLPDIPTRCGYATGFLQQQGQQLVQQQQQGREAAHEEQREPPAPSHAAPARLPSHDYECSICHDIIFNPVVGSCGHDFCYSCLQKWQRCSSSFTCPVCRQQLPSNLGVCQRLKSVMEFFFPEQLDRRRREQDLRAESEAQQSSGSDSSSRGLCRHLSLIRAPNPITFEAAVQEQQQQQRRRAQQQLELQQLNAELNSAFTPESSSQGVLQFLRGADAHAEHDPPHPATLPSSFMDVQRAHWLGPPCPGAADYNPEPHSLHSWLASQPLSEQPSVQHAPAVSAASPPRDILRPRRCPNTADRRCEDTLPSQPSSWHGGTGVDVTGGSGSANDAHTPAHTWGGRHVRAHSAELTHARGHGHRWEGAGVVGGDACTAGSGHSVSTGARAPGQPSVSSGLGEGCGGGSGASVHRRHASGHSVHWQGHRSSSGEHASMLLEAGGTALDGQASQDDSECPVSTVSTMLPARSSSLGGGRRSSACDSDRGGCGGLAAERSEGRSSACNSSGSTTLELAGSAGGGSCASQQWEAGSASNGGGSAGGSGWCMRSSCGASGSQQPLLDAVEQRLRAVHSGQGNHNGGHGGGHSSLQQQQHAHGALSGQAGGRALAGSRCSLDAGGETSSVDSRRVSGSGEPGDGLPSTPRAGGEQAAQAANAFFGCFSPRHSGGASPASSTCGGGRRAQSPAQGSYGPGSYPPSPKQPRSPITGTSPTHSRMPTLSSSPSHNTTTTASFAPPGLRATPLANAHASSGLAAWGLWSPHSSLAHASAAHAHHPLAHARHLEPGASAAARDGSAPTATHVQPPFPLSSLVHPSKAQQHAAAAQTTHHHHLPSASQAPQYFFGGGNAGSGTQSHQHTQRPSSAPHSPSRKLSFPDRLAEAAHSSRDPHAHTHSSLASSRACTAGLGASSVLSRVHAAGANSSAVPTAAGSSLNPNQHPNHHNTTSASQPMSAQQPPLDAARPPLPQSRALRGGLFFTNKGRSGPLPSARELGRVEAGSVGGGPLPSAREFGMGAGVAAGGAARGGGGLGSGPAGEELAGSARRQSQEAAEQR